MEITENQDKLYRYQKYFRTAASITGGFGKNLKKLSLQLIEHQLAHFIGSDVHNTTNRSFHWNLAHQMVESKLGIEYVDLLQQNAERVITNKQINKRQPEHVMQKKWLGIF
jgi:protein-tyrosine phosphatase